MPYFSGVRYKIDEKTNCWFAVSHKPNKGGYIFINRVFLKGYIHRLIYVDRVKTLLPGEKIRHTCKNKTCVNPAHLYSSMKKEH